VVAGPGAAAAPVPRGQSLEETKQREAAAASALEDSSSAVREAGVALAEVEVLLPQAQSDVAQARGELVGAQAKLKAAQTAAAEAERAVAASRSRVSAADDAVQEGRDDVNALARHSYQQGRLGSLRSVLEAGEPQEALQRAGMLRKVFRFQDGTLDRLTRDRLSLARQEADLDAQERAAERARAAAADGAARARQITLEAEDAAARVVQLVARQQAAVALAEANREQDERDYAAAQNASREMAERIRQAAAQAAAEEARRQAEAAAAAAAADRAARAAAARSGRAAPPPAPPAPRSAAPAAAGRMLWPVAGRITSRYGNRVHPIYGTVRLHTGLDIGAPNGTRISAAQAGTVLVAGPSGGYGNYVVVSHGTVNGVNLSTGYAHMSSIGVTVGQRVGAGQTVGAVGSTGASTGNHLHFEVRRDGEPTDPLGYVSPP
jgi:murein DD-endopeptidase MepM/ murein hydrolase activator NlpD